MRYQLRLSAPNPDTKDFSRKVLWNLKSFAKIKWYVRCESFCGFLRGKPLEARFGTAVPTYSDNLKSTAMPCFLCALSVGAIRPKPGHKGLFEKSPLESQKLCQNKVICSVRSSLAYLSYKKGKLRKRGGEMFVYMFARNKTFYSKKNQFCVENQAHFCSVFEIKSSFFFNRCN